MQNTKLGNPREDSCNTYSSADGREQTMGRFFNATQGLLVLAAVVCALPAQSQPAIVSFDPPDSVSTIVNGISTSGLITGGYTDIYTNNHGFLRTPDGRFTTFDAPGASTNISPSGICITSAGEIAGNYERYGGVVDFGFGPQAFYLNAGFLRHPDGTILNIDPSTAIESGPGAINAQGTIVGTFFSYVDFANHFYVRTPGGAFTAFDPEPGALPWAMGINPAGTIVGSYRDTNFVLHSFLRTAKGAVTLFDDPDGVNGTSATSISPNGSITGFFLDTNYNAHGFVINQTGRFTTFDPEGSISTTPSSGTGNAPNGTIVGSYLDTNYISHGFVRASSGKITTFDPEGSVNTFVAGVNPGGLITGYYYNNPTNYLAHGFVFQTKD